MSQESLLTARAARFHIPLLGEMLSSRGNKPELNLKTLPELSEKMWGVGTKELTVIGARTSQGKTSFALQVCMDLASQGFPVVYLSLEMTVHSILERMFCNMENIPNYDLQKGGFSKYKTQWNHYSNHINEIPLIVTEGIGKSWSEIDGLIERMNPKPRVIILDYIQCVKGTGIEKIGIIDEYIRHFRQMAIEYNFAAIACSQINRSGASEDGSEPQLHNLKGSGYIEELADKIILMHWPHFYNAQEDKNKYTLILAKNRNGKTGKVNIKYIPEFYKFEDESRPVEITDNVAAALEVFGGRAFESTVSPKYVPGKVPQMRT